MAVPVHLWPRMTVSPTSAEMPPNAILQALLASHGELMQGPALAELFKFGSDRSFRRAAAAASLPIEVFRLPGRRGWFARTRDVELWLRKAPVAGAATFDAPTARKEGVTRP